MAVSRRGFLAALTGATAATALAACRQQQTESAPATTEAASNVNKDEFKALNLDMKAWHYDAEHDAWWQLGLTYCLKPASASHEKLAIYVPGPYLVPTDEKANLEDASSSATFSCKLNPEGTQGKFTCATAPIVLPINAADFAAQPAATSYLYDGLEPYLSAGCVYVYAGARGRSNGYDSSSAGEGFYSGGAPWAVADLKAAVRYLRYNAATLPGNAASIVPFGHAAGGLLAAIMGASGNASIYQPYLDELGVATHTADGATVGDEVAAAMCWCPEPSAGIADEAYEWGLGQFVSDDTRAEGEWTKLLSSDLAEAYAKYVNDLALVDGDGQTLSLDETDGGIFTDGTYSEHLVQMVADAASTFLAQTAFPHTFEPADKASGEFPGSGVPAVETPEVPVPEDEAADGDGATDDASADQTSAPEPVTYATRSDYVSALNADGRWLTFNERRGTARVMSLSGYVRACRQPLAPVLSYDATDRSSAVNQLFGVDDDESLHFSTDVASLVSANSETYAQASGWDADLPGDWASDLGKTDVLKQTMVTRRNMYDPLYFLCGNASGFGTATVAPHWRINVGMQQSGLPISTSANLACALKAYDGVEGVELTPVWEQGRTLAERAGAEPEGAFTDWLAGLFAGNDAATDEAATE